MQMGSVCRPVNTSWRPKGAFQLPKEQEYLLMAILEGDSSWSGEWTQLLLLCPQGGGP